VFLSPVAIGTQKVRQSSDQPVSRDQTAPAGSANDGIPHLARAAVGGKGVGFLGERRASRQEYANEFPRWRVERVEIQSPSAARADTLRLASSPPCRLALVASTAIGQTRCQTGRPWGEATTCLLQASSQWLTPSIATERVFSESISRSARTRSASTCRSRCGASAASGCLGELAHPKRFQT
jgi:hypothetical protein